MKLVAIVLDAQVNAGPAYIGLAQILPPGDARQLAHIDRLVHYRPRQSRPAAAHRKGEVHGEGGLPDGIGSLADEVEIAEGAGGVALVLASSQIASDLTDAGDRWNSVGNMLVADAHVGSAKLEAYGDCLDVGLILTRCFAKFERKMNTSERLVVLRE